MTREGTTRRLRWLSTIAVLTVISSVTPTFAAGLQDREAITDLIYCYARGNDAIGNATTNENPAAAGLAIYRECVAEDVEIQAWFPHRAVSALAFPDPSRYPDPPHVYHGLDEWVQHISSLFRSKGYTFTQHVITNVEPKVNGPRGTLTAYLTATLVTSGTIVGGLSQCVTVANGTYSANVAKTKHGWRIQKMYVTLITFNPVVQSGAGCSG